MTHDRGEHHLLDSPWQAPFRTATGASGIALFLVLTLAGGNDVLAALLDVPVEWLTRPFRVLVLVAPVITWCGLPGGPRSPRLGGAREDPASVLLEESGGRVRGGGSEP